MNKGTMLFFSIEVCGYLFRKKLIRAPKNLGVDRPLRSFWGPLLAILDFAGGAALQVLSECPLRR